uniref:Uncharacterized protein n=1 Tax=Ixodes ricinus TaxID=34613 RepID=A0A6B0UUK9_IXORI
MPLSTAMQRPMMTSSLTFSMMVAASPATSANSTGARYRFQKRKSSPRLPVVLPTCPKRLELGSQKMRSKQRTTLFRFPNPRREIAAPFHSGSGGTNWTVLGRLGLLRTDCLRTPRGSVQRTASALKVARPEFVLVFVVVTSTPVPDR